MQYELEKKERLEENAIYIEEALEIQKEYEANHTKKTAVLAGKKNKNKYPYI